MWLNDSSVDGFLGNLRDYENFIVTDAKWDASMETDGLGYADRPNETTLVTAAVGLINLYEYQESYRGSTYRNGYLNNGLYWWLLTPTSSTNLRYVGTSGYANERSSSSARGIRPAINLKSTVKIASGSGTATDPYRLNGDHDSNLTGTKLNSRYSGEYLTFGTGENNLYQIVSHETEGLTKIVSSEPLKNTNSFQSLALGNVNFSSTTTMGSFLNGSYLTNYVGNNYINMIADNTTWYLGTVGEGENYRLAKYTDTNMTTTTTSTTAKVGLLRFGELLSGQFERNIDKDGETNTGLTADYWLLTPYSSSNVWYIYSSCYGDDMKTSVTYGIRPAMNLKSNVIITGGDGTKENPFTLALQS